MSFIRSTGLGIQSTDPRFWVPQPSRSVIMSRSRLRAFMGRTGVRQAMRPTPSTPATAFGSGRQGISMPAPTLSSLG